MHDMVDRFFFWVMNEKNKVQDGSHYKLAESLSPELMVAPRLGSFHSLLKACKHALTFSVSLTSDD